MCKGDKTESGIPLSHTQMKICCEETPVPNCDGQHGDYEEKNRYD